MRCPAQACCSELQGKGLETAEGILPAFGAEGRPGIVTTGREKTIQHQQNEGPADNPIAPSNWNAIMKGLYVAAVLLSALSSLCQAAVNAPVHGTIHFSGSVVGSGCALTTHATAAVKASCPLDAVAHSLSVQTSINEQTAHIQVLAANRSTAQYSLVNAAGRRITQGHYVITQTIL